MWNDRERKNGIAIQERLIEKERNLPKDEVREEGLQELLKERAEKRRMQAVTGNGTAEPLRFDVLRSEFLGKMTRSEEKRVAEMNKLVGINNLFTSSIDPPKRFNT